MTDASSFIAVPRVVRGICESLERRGFRSWIVGGCVRDALRRKLKLEMDAADRPPTDWDIATDARPEQVQKTFPRVIPTGIEHGTVTVVIDKVHYEVTTLRADLGYSDGRRPDKVEFVADIVGDLARRDFTINAIAYDVLHDELIDPFDGIADLKAHRLRAVGNPLDRFAEDGLRVLRAARFLATLELVFDPATENAIRPSLASYRKVSAERIRDEWKKSLKAPRPSIAFEVMRQHGLLEITCPGLLQTMAANPGTDSAPEAWQHALCCLDGAPKKLEIQLAALLHASPTLPKDEAARVEEQAAESAVLADRVLRDLRFSNQERERTVALVRHHLTGYQRSWSGSDVRRWLRRVGPTLVADLLLLLEVKAGAATDREEQRQLVFELRERVTRELTSGAPLAVRDLAIGGTDLIRELKLPPGPRIGTLLDQLLDEVLDDPSLNQRDTLLARAGLLLRERPAE